MGPGVQHWEMLKHRREVLPLEIVRGGIIMVFSFLFLLFCFVLFYVDVPRRDRVITIILPYHRYMKDFARCSSKH